MAAARRFAPTFTAEVVPGAVVRKDGAKGPYLVSKGASMRTPDGKTAVRTLMSFGDQAMKVLPNLRPGMPVRLELRLDGGTMIAVGIDADAAPQQPAAPTTKRRRMSKGLMADCVAAAGFEEHAAY